MTNDRFTALSLRVQKRARTRQALVDALLPLLSERALEDIAISELCSSAGISQATFFNYFPNKPALLTFFIRVWSLRVSALAVDIIAEHDSSLRAIEALLAHTAAQTAEAPNIMLEIIAHQARMTPDTPLPPVELPDRYLLLPDVEDVMALSDEGLGGVLPILLAGAAARGEIPPGSDIPSLTLAVASVFFGVPLALGRSRAAMVGPAYQQQLQLVWTAARGVS
ncbi:MAG: AcrR family transcriptional regulator [Myxococcota bacterium]|jgi:AcrR family transcriptional regulator